MENVNFFMLISPEYPQITGIQRNDTFPIPDRIPRGCQGSSMGISYPVFQGCTNLATLNIGNNVKVIPSYAYYNSVAATRLPNREWFPPWAATTATFPSPLCESQSPQRGRWIVAVGASPRMDAPPTIREPRRGGTWRIVIVSPFQGSLFRVRYLPWARAHG